MSLDKNLNKILIIDFGSQFTQLVSRKIRELGVYSDIINSKNIRKIFNNKSIKGVILSGGPLSATKRKSLKLDKSIINLKVPIFKLPNEPVEVAEPLMFPLASPIVTLPPNLTSV